MSAPAADTFEGQKISPITYACFVCAKRGYPSIQIYLAGKDDDGRPKRLELDKKTLHVHKGTASGKKAESSHVEHLLKEIMVKLDAIMSAVNAPPIEDPDEAYPMEPEA